MNYDSSIRNRLLKTIERLPLSAVERVKDYVDNLLKESEPLSLSYIKKHREEIISIAEKRGIKNIAIFGSLVKGENTGISDIDFLVDLEPETGLFDLSGFMVDMEELLGYRVDVALRSDLKDNCREEILREAVEL